MSTSELIPTDPGDKPSVRFEKVLFHHLEKEGYSYLKSKNEFTQDFELGRRIISLHYTNDAGYISSVQYFVKIIFYDLEKAFKKIYPKYGWANWTVHLNLHWTDGWLCDKETGEYTDKTINSLALEFFATIKPQADRLFTEISNYESLHKLYNSRPLHFFDYLPTSRLEKRIVNGLILTKTFEPESYDEIKREYLTLLDKYKGNDVEDLKAEIHSGLVHLDNNLVVLRK